MKELAKFLNDRLDADAEAAPHYTRCSSARCENCSHGPLPCDCGVPERTALDILAKRMIIDNCIAIIDNHVSGDFAAHHLAEDTLTALAASYADHPDYRSDWMLTVPDQAEPKL
ncbi:DUF6221 family protein [Rhodococcus qingshengii]|uniref:DUF6221 family protein n=1 Tax=Rhodococcus TaxID=1827 RepID=UPI000F621B04|nr:MULTISPECIES: DUF6221 family protein [Rhodococcus]AZI62772.1 hypothetical protein EHW12_17565 [Rhodococcus sp. NJ-530]BDQ21113.1 DUF6221 family protein [Rhodococcus qingshengii]